MGESKKRLTLAEHIEKHGSQTPESDLIQIKAHVPQSFWHVEGAYRASLKLLNEGIPSCKGAKFITLTAARNRDGVEIYDSPADCYEQLKKEPAYLVQRLRGAGFPITAYIVKLELHEDGFPHWHLVVWCKSMIPYETLNKYWDYGYTQINAVRKDKGLLYTLKYSFKGVEPPEWVKSYGRIQVCRKSVRFYESLAAAGIPIVRHPTRSQFNNAGRFVKKKNRQSRYNWS